MFNAVRYFEQTVLALLRRRCGVLLVRSRHQVHTVRLATGEYYAFGLAIAQVAKKHSPIIEIAVLESPGSSQNMSNVNNHTVDMALGSDR
ncbi:MAG: hypothetical protein DCF25_02135 [Leptolyngbya foveolarum]|jgi:TRAP-type uncharacterized transport system substrate-binding protein|uniref:Uncharacterized protein n=1 Tax=Leptolyngbya foveolarum TaxID=47253 RepID=A0A2W4URJ2_9CYAN|nr:MAG: hypothetical protein DCF25_02135 [Leptolyngbya foveolarum]